MVPTGQRSPTVLAFPGKFTTQCASCIGRSTRRQINDEVSVVASPRRVAVPSMATMQVLKIDRRLRRMAPFIVLYR